MQAQHLPGIVLLLLLSPIACIDDAASVGNAATPALDPAPNTRVASRLSVPGVTATIQSTTYRYAASASCQPAFLPSPAGGEREPTLSLGVSCSFDASEGPARDSFIAYQRQVRCFTDGTADDVRTWEPPQGVEVVPPSSGERAYGQVIPPYGDLYLSSALTLTVVDDFAFCTVEAWGVIRSNADEGWPRAAVHREGPPVVHWRVVIEPTDSGYQCTASDETAVEIRRIAATTHRVPAPSERDEWPVTQDVMLLVEAHLETSNRAGTFVHGGVRAIFLAAAEYPPAAEGPVGTFASRDLWIEDPATGVPRDTSVRRSCADFDPVTGQPDRVAVALESGDERVGGIIMRPHIGGGLFDCERERAGGCISYTEDELRAAAACLGGGGL